MAEAIAIVGIVASIVQLVDFSSRVLRRLDEFQSNQGELPGSFRHVKAELPVLKYTLQYIRDAIEAGSGEDETKKALIPAIEGCTEQIRLLEPILAKILPTSTDSQLRIHTKAILSFRQESKVDSITKVLQRYIGTLTFYYAAISSTLQPLTDAKLSEIRQWLSPPDPSLNYQKALKRRQTDTGLWFLKSDEYIAWKTNPASFIWLYGIPGCGKTILSSTILQNVLEYCANDPGKAVAYFYFDFNDAQKQSPELMVRSLLCQFSQQCVKVSTALETLFSSFQNGQQQPSLDGLLEAMHSMMQEFPQSYIVLDALDECADRAELMAMLEGIAKWKLNALHLLVTSRRERDIEISLETIVNSQNTICLQSEVVDRDILRYVHQRLSDDKSLSKWHKDPYIRHEIETVLMKGARGMFRWAVCQLDTLGKCRNRFKLRESLARLPLTLDETYNRILCAIDKEDSDYAIRILQWLVFSQRPLLVEEIAEVVAIDVERNPAFNSEEVLQDPLEVLSICSSLVTITASGRDIDSMDQSKIVTLAHYSVKEYLISERILQGRAASYSMQDISCHEFIAKSCICYLLQFQAPDSVSSESIRESKLALYAAQFWITHTKVVSQRAKTLNALNALIMQFFSTGNGAYLNWARMYNPVQPWDEPSFGKALTEVPAPLFYASFSGLTELVALLVFKAEAEINVHEGEYDDALQAAAIGGHYKTIELLLSKGADVNAHGGRDRNALQAAARGGHNEAIELLLSKGADINAQGGIYGNALHMAVIGGHDKTIELLLSNGADINAPGSHYGNALQMAVIGGYDKTIELLLSKGADINVQGGNNNNALQTAAMNGYDKTVELLLSKGADVNAKGGQYANAVQAAARGGHVKTIELLLSKGADINAQGGNYGNALQMAIIGGHNKTIKLLLSNGADINAQGGEYGNALQAAAAMGYDKTVELLLSEGADINAQGGEYSNALEAAAAMGHGQIMELLLSKGAKRL